MKKNKTNLLLTSLLLSTCLSFPAVAMKDTVRGDSDTPLSSPVVALKETVKSDSDADTSKTPSPVASKPLGKEDKKAQKKAKRKLKRELKRKGHDPHDRVNFKKPEVATITGNFNVTLEKIKIARTFGYDRGNPEEGRIIITIGEQETALYWQGWTGPHHIHRRKPYVLSHVEAGKDAEMVLFAGNLGSSKDLKFKISITEVDKEDKERWERASAVLEKLSGIANLPVTGAPIAAAGFGIFSRIAKIISQSMKDTQELFHSGSLTLDGKITEGLYQLWRDGDEGEKDIEVGFRIAAFHPKKPPKDQRVRVFLENMRYGEELAKKVSKQKGSVVLELKTGDKVLREDFLPNALEHGVVSFKEVKLYEGPWEGYLPFSSSIICAQGESEAPLKSILTLHEDLKKMFVALASKDALPKVDPAALEKITKHGVIFFDLMDTASSAILAGVTHRHEVTFFSVGKTFLTQAKEVINMPLYIKTEPVGSLTFDLMIEHLEEDKPHTPAEGGSPSSSLGTGAKPSTGSEGTA